MWMLALLLLASPADAAKGKGGGKKKNKAVEVPIDIGVGPAGHWITGPVANNQSIHSGLAFSVEAVLDKKLLRKFKNRIPKQYRSTVLGMDELRISHPLIPDTFFISPAGIVGDTGIYGVSWRPIGINVPLINEGVGFDVGVGARFTYFYLHSQSLENTHFVRPGIDAKAEFEIPFSDRFLVSFGWDSQFYIPQTLGGGVFEAGPLDESIWHVGQGFLKFHFRVPVTVKP